MKRSNSPREEEDGKLRQWSSTLQLSAAGLTLAFSVLIGAGFGYWLDQKFKTSYWVPVWATLGVIAGFRELLKAVNRANQEEDRLQRERREQRDDDDRGTTTGSD